jgi:hypothetical protein
MTWRSLPPCGLRSRPRQAWVASRPSRARGEQGADAVAPRPSCHTCARSWPGVKSRRNSSDATTVCTSWTARTPGTASTNVINGSAGRSAVLPPAAVRGSRPASCHPQRESGRYHRRRVDHDGHHRPDRDRDAAGAVHADLLPARQRRDLAVPPSARRPRRCAAGSMWRGAAAWPCWPLTFAPPRRWPWSGRRRRYWDRSGRPSLVSARGAAGRAGLSQRRHPRPRFGLVAARAEHRRLDRRMGGSTAVGAAGGANAVQGRASGLIVFSRLLHAEDYGAGRSDHGGRLAPRSWSTTACSQGRVLSGAPAVVGPDVRTACTSMRLGLTSSTLGTRTWSTPSSVDAWMASALTCSGRVIERRKSP